MPLSSLDRLGRCGFALFCALLGLSLVWVVGGLATSWSWHPPGFVNQGGANIGRDFIAFFAAARLALLHQPAAAYDFVQLHAMETQVIGAPVPLFAFFYPPIFELLALPLGWLPYPVALALWLAAPLIGFVAALRQWVSRRWLAMAALLFPGTAQCLISGQNGVLSALLVLGGLRWLEERPLVAGALIGALGYKPQLALAAFAALLFGGYWRALGAAIGTLLVLAATSAALFGLAPWLAFLGHLGAAGAALQQGEIPWERMVTFYAAARLAGFGPLLAALLQGVAAAAALVALAFAWRQRSLLAWRGSVLALTMPMLTPYAYDYDLVVLLLPLAWLADIGLTQGFRRYEAALLAMAWLSPVAGWLLARWSHLQLTPLILVLLLIALLRRGDRGTHDGAVIPAPSSAAAAAAF